MSKYIHFLKIFFILFFVFNIFLFAQDYENKIIGKYEFKANYQQDFIEIFEDGTFFRFIPDGNYARGKHYDAIMRGRWQINKYKLTFDYPEDNYKEVFEYKLDQTVYGKDALFVRFSNSQQWIIYKRVQTRTIF